MLATNPGFRHTFGVDVSLLRCDVMWFCSCFGEIDRVNLRPEEGHIALEPRIPQATLPTT